jgi:hypothetical protein
MTREQTNQNPSRILMSDFEVPRGSTSETARGQANHDREQCADARIRRNQICSFTAKRPRDGAAAALAARWVGGYNRYSIR